MKQNLAPLSFFSDVDSAHKAYWLGFLAADGCTDLRQGLTVHLAAKDASHLRKLARVFGAAEKVKPYLALNSVTGKRHAAVRLAVNSRALARQLTALGVGPNKRRRFQWPVGVPDAFAMDFIRGYFDGDGSVTSSPSWRSYRLVCSFVGQPEFIHQLHGRLKSYGGSYMQKSANCGILQFADLGAERLLQELYERPGPSLWRKRRRVEVHMRRKERRRGKIAASIRATKARDARIARSLRTKSARAVARKHRISRRQVLKIRARHQVPVREQDQQLSERGHQRRRTRYVRHGGNQTKVAEAEGVSKNAISIWAKRQRQQGTLPIIEVI